MSRVSVQSEGGDGCFPRVSGDEPYPWETLPMSPKFSPRERG